MQVSAGKKSPDSRAGRPYKQVQGLARGIALLWALKMHPAGSASVSQLAAETRLHRTTVKRLLETLSDIGFVQYAPSTRLYSLTFRVWQLGEAYRDEGSVGETARPFLRKLTEKALWPSNVVTLDEETRLVIRESTHALSPLSFRDGVLGVSVPILESAVGRAYLAFCPDEERAAIMEILRLRAKRDRKRFSGDDSRVRSILEEARRSGYAVNDLHEEGDAMRLGAIAVPIRQGPKVLACINIIYLRSAISTDQMVKRHLSDLMDTAAQIERKFTEMKIRRDEDWLPYRGVAASGDIEDLSGRYRHASAL